MAQRDRAGEPGPDSGLFALPTKPSASLSSVTEPLVSFSPSLTVTPGDR